MARLFGSANYSRNSLRGSSKSGGVKPSVRAARARKGHKRRSQRLFASQGATRGYKTTYRKRRRYL